MAPDHLGSPALDLLGMAMFFLQWGDQNWTQYPDVALQVLYRGEGSRPLARLFLIQPRSLLAAFAAKGHTAGSRSVCPPGPPGPLLQSRSPAGRPRTLLVHGVTCICFC